MWRDTSFDVGTGWLPIPDLGFIGAARVPPESLKSVKGVPDLVVEIHSPTDLRSQKEREATRRKKLDWLSVGVQIVWSVNTRSRTVEVYHRGQSSPTRTLGEEDELSGENVIPGFRMKVKELFG